MIDSLLLCQNCLRTSELGFLCLAVLIVGGKGEKKVCMKDNLIPVTYLKLFRKY